MHNVFARFPDCASAQQACSQVGAIHGIDRVGTRAVVPPPSADGHNPHSAEAIAVTVSHSSAASPGDGAVVDAARREAEYDRRTGLDRPGDRDYMLCAQGSQEAVERAAGLLRDLGAHSVDVRDSDGDFLSGHPPVM